MFLGPIIFFILLPFLFMVGMYVCIFVAIRKQKRRVRSLQEAQRRPIALRQKREIKILKMFLVVAVLYIVSWIPLLLHETVREIEEFNLPGFQTSLAVQVFMFGALLTSLLNPFIYTFTKQDFKREIRNIYRKTRRVPQALRRSSRNKLTARPSM